MYIHNAWYIKHIKYSHLKHIIHLNEKTGYFLSKYCINFLPSEKNKKLNLKISSYRPLGYAGGIFKQNF